MLQTEGTRTQQPLSHRLKQHVLVQNEQRTDRQRGRRVLEEVQEQLQWCAHAASGQGSTTGGVEGCVRRGERKGEVCLFGRVLRSCECKQST